MNARVIARPGARTTLVHGVRRVVAPDHAAGRDALVDWHRDVRQDRRPPSPSESNRRTRGAPSFAWRTP